MKYSNEQLRHIAREAAEKHNIDPKIFFSLIELESKWNCSAVSEKGAIGIAQVIPIFHPQLRNPWDCVESLHYAAFVLSKYRADYNGRWDLTLAAYHMGKPTVDLMNGVLPSYELNGYVKTILDLSKSMEIPESIATATASIDVPLSTIAATETPVVTPTPTPVLQNEMLATPTPTPTSEASYAPSTNYIDFLFVLLPVIWIMLTRR